MEDKKKNQPEKRELDVEELEKITGGENSDSLEDSIVKRKTTDISKDTEHNV